MGYEGNHPQAMLRSHAFVFLRFLAKALHETVFTLSVLSSAHTSIVQDCVDVVLAWEYQYDQSYGAIRGM